MNNLTNVNVHDNIVNPHLYDIGFQSTIADPDIWRQPAVKHDGENYCEYDLCYVDSIIVVSDGTKHVMKQIQEHSQFRNNKFNDPGIYDGAKIEEIIHDGKQIWTMSSHEYLSAAIKEVESTHGTRLDPKEYTPLPKNYVQELD